MDLSIVILTKNEEVHIGRALEHLRAVTLDYEVLVVDSYSSDATCEIARSLGAKVVRRHFRNYADQFQWALDSGLLRGDWVMRLDADEVVGDDLAHELAAAVRGAGMNETSFSFDRRHIFNGRWIKHGGRFPLRLTRVWRAGMGHIEQRWMDEHIVVSRGKARVLRGRFEDDNKKGLTFFIDKHNGYATREAIDVLIAKLHLPVTQESLHRGAGSRQALRKRWIKLRIYNQLPYGLGATLYFVWRIIFQGGFLDGSSGILYHFLQGYWYRLLVGAKVREFLNEVEQIEDPYQQVARLEDLTGYQLLSRDVA